MEGKGSSEAFIEEGKGKRKRKIFRERINALWICFTYCSSITAHHSQIFSVNFPGKFQSEEDEEEKLRE